MKNEDWEKALNEVLDADAVPTTSLDEFVAACMIERRGRWSSFAEWLSAPKRAVASTVAGSMLLTCALISLVLFSPVQRPERTSVGTPHLQMAMGLGYSIRKGDWENGF